jgi:DDE_Tnp_1-associated
MSILEYFGDLPDPRRPYLVSHRLLDIVTITLCGLLAGADTWVEIELFARTREAWLRRFLELPAGVPTHDTLGRVFAALDPHVFTQAFAQWAEAVRQTLPVPESEPLKVRAIDGKQMRSTASQGGTALDVVRVW